MNGHHLLKIASHAVTTISFVLIAACTSNVAPPAPSPSSTVASAARAHRPLSQDACATCNGVWGIHGAELVETCVCPTSDPGKSCMDGGDCQGACIVSDDASLEVVDPGTPARGYFVGQCSAYDVTFGCYRIIPTGTAALGAKTAEEAAEYICVD